MTPGSNIPCTPQSSHPIVTLPLPLLTLCYPESVTKNQNLGQADDDFTIPELIRESQSTKILWVLPP